MIVLGSRQKRQAKISRACVNGRTGRGTQQCGEARAPSGNERPRLHPNIPSTSAPSAKAYRRRRSLQPIEAPFVTTLSRGIEAAGEPSVFALRTSPDTL